MASEPVQLVVCPCGAVAEPDARYKAVGGDPAHPHEFGADPAYLLSTDAFHAYLHHVVRRAREAKVDDYSLVAALVEETRAAEQPIQGEGEAGE